jgi:vancomycin resistance protein YoaR
MDIPATVQQVMDAPPSAAVTPVYRQTAASVTAAGLKQARRLGACRTEILDRTPARVHNIRLAAALINNTVIEPGYEFSFNRRLGEPTADRGFLPATIFAEGRLEQDVGGGVCQVSSTVYNAALAAGLTITERHPHSRPVAYVPPGRDATTYTDKDLRFINSTRRRIIVRSLLTSGGLAADIWELSP